MMGTITNQEGRQRGIRPTETRFKFPSRKRSLLGAWRMEGDVPMHWVIELQRVPLQAVRVVEIAPRA